MDRARKTLLVFATAVLAAVAAPLLRAGDPPTGKAAKKWSGVFPFKYEMDAGDTRFVGKPAGGTDWSGTYSPRWA